jgi:hypothetical protein
VYKTGKVIDHLAAGDNRIRDLVSAGAGLIEKIVQGLGYGAKVAPATCPTTPGALYDRLRVRLHALVQMVKYLAIDRKEHGFQRGGTDVYPKKQRPIHEDTRLLQENLAANLRSEIVPDHTSAAKCFGQAPLSAGGLYPGTVYRRDSN